MYTYSTFMSCVMWKLMHEMLWINDKDALVLMKNMEIFGMQ